MLPPVPDRANDQQQDCGTHNHGCRIFEKGEKVQEWHGALIPSEDQS
jgi:hypothetical protein